METETVGVLTYLYNGQFFTSKQLLKRHANLVSLYAARLQLLEFWKRNGTYGDGRPELAYRELFAAYRELRNVARVLSYGGRIVERQRGEGGN